MSIRVDVQMDHESASMRFVATAKLDGKCLHKVEEYGGIEAREEVIRKMAEWLDGREYPRPDHYHQQEFSPEEQWVPKEFPRLRAKGGSGTTR